MTQDYERNTTISADLTTCNADGSSNNTSLTTTISSMSTHNADECSNTSIITPVVDVTTADSTLTNNAEAVVNNLDVSMNNESVTTTNVNMQTTNTELTGSDGVNSTTTNAELTESDGVAREKFIRFLLAMNKKPIELNLYENTKVKGFFEAADTSFRNIAVSQLLTPIAVYDSATIRTSDIMTISVNLLDMP